MKRTLATLDPANVIKSRLRDLDIPVNLFGRYLDKSSSEICSLLNGAKRLSDAKEKEFKGMLDGLELVANAVSPVPVNFRDVENVSAALHQILDGSLIIGV